MKYKALIIGAFCAAALVVLSSSTAFAAGEVELQLSRYFQSDTSGSCEACVTFNGVIEVEDLAYDKAVQVVYRHPMFGDWRTLSAAYVGPSRDGYQYWGFSQELVGFDGIRFAVSFTVAGQTYWDNNGGDDYYVAKGVPVLAGAGIEVALTKDEAPLLRRFPGQIGYLGSVHVADLAYDKVVTLRYTTDSWDTWSDATARYQWTESNGLQRWSFELSLPLDAAEVEFAVSYQVAGASYWDNNFGRNYRFDTP